MDGDIDYSHYSRQDLEEAASRIDRTQFPKNYDNIIAAMRQMPALTPSKVLVRPASMWLYSVVAFVCAAAMLVLVVFVNVTGWLNTGILGGLAAMLVSAYVASWLFARRYRRPLLSIEICWLAIACFLGYWLSGEVLKFANRSPEVMTSTSVGLVEGIASSIFDLIIIFVMLRFIVPWTLKRYWKH